MITPQSVLFEAQVKNYFTLQKSYVPFSRYSSFCGFSHNLAILWQGTFWIYLLNHYSLTHQTWSIGRSKQGQYFPETFWTIWRTGAKFQALFNLAVCSNYSITNYVKIPVYHFFEKLNKAQLKIVNVNY